MTVRLIGLALASSVLTACASSWSQSDHRWRAIEAGGPHSAWGRCVDDFSHRYLDPGSAEAPPAWHDSKSSASEQVVFTWVLAACAKHMEGAGWDHIQPNTYQRLLKDAHNHFYGVSASIQAELDAQQI